MYKKQIKSFKPTLIQEEEDKKNILEYIDKVGDLSLTRESKSGHLTSSAFIFNKDFSKTLMIHHNIYNAWGWTGGHADGDTNLLQVALKEASEETGVCNFTPLTSDIITIDVIPVSPHYKKGKYIGTHLHFNVTYCLIACEDEKLFIKDDENSGVKWILLDDLEKEVNEPDMIPIYIKIIEKSKKYKDKGGLQYGI